MPLPKRMRTAQVRENKREKNETISLANENAGLHGIRWTEGQAALALPKVNCREKRLITKTTNSASLNKSERVCAIADRTSESRVPSPDILMVSLCSPSRNSGLSQGNDHNCFTPPPKVWRDALVTVVEQSQQSVREWITSMNKSESA